MSETVPGEVLRFLADMEDAVSAVIDKHVTSDSEYMQHYVPIGVYVTSIDGVLAQFLEEGVELYPRVAQVPAT